MQRELHCRGGRWLVNMEKIETNGGNTCSNERLLSESSKSFNESSSIEKEVCDSVFINHGMPFKGPLIKFHWKFI